MSHFRPATVLLQGAIAGVSEFRESQAGTCGTTLSHIWLCEISRLVRDLQLVDARGRKYLAADERRRFLEAAARAPRPADQTFALTLAHTGARVSEALAVCPRDVYLEAASIRIRTLKRRAERWREVPVPANLARALELTHALRSTPAKAAGKPLWPWSRATAHRKTAKIMADASIEGPQACPKGLRHGFGIAAIAAGVPLPTIAAVLGHADIATTAFYTRPLALRRGIFWPGCGKGRWNPVNWAPEGLRRERVARMRDRTIVS